MNKKLAAFLAALTLLFSLAVPVFAADDARVVLGADLNEEQIAAVYKLFDIERGSVLSHSAVIAREMGIPLVVGVRGLTEKVPDGARVRVDGINGTVTVLEEANG